MAWTQKAQIAPYSPSPYLQTSPYLGFKSCNFDPANLASTSGWPTGVALFCRAFVDVPGVISALETNVIQPDTTVALSGVYMGVYDATGAGGLPGNLLGVTADLSATIRAMTTGVGGKLPANLVTPTSALTF